MKFTESNVLLDCNMDTKIEMLKYIANHAVTIGVTNDKEQLLQDFLLRESEGTTGFQDGFAIPHAKSESISQATVIYARNNSGLKDWETLDDVDVSQIFALLVPKNEQGTKHIEMLSKLATALMEDDFKQQVTKLVDKKELAKIIDNEMNGVEVL